MPIEPPRDNALEYDLPTFRLTMLPASDGDCLLLTWGGDGKCSHAVIDGGRAGAYPHLHQHLARMAGAGEPLELYVLTHIDADHIAGALSYLKARNRPIEPKEVWYNGFRQIRQGDTRSMAQGDAYSVELEKLGWPQNAAFERGVVSVETAPSNIEIAGLRLTILSPDTASLRALGNRWAEWRREQELLEREQREGRGDTRASRKRERPPVPDPLVVETLIADGETDSEIANGSSIAFVAEWNEKRILLTGDAHPGTLATSLLPLAERDGGRYRLDLLKASHHGSAKNTSRELVQLLNCQHLAISTNGKLHCHPDPEAIARFIHFGVEGRKTLHFNYATDRTLPWNAESTKTKYGYEARFPSGTPGELAIDLF